MSIVNGVPRLPDRIQEWEKPRIEQYLGNLALDDPRDIQAATQARSLLIREIEGVARMPLRLLRVPSQFRTLSRQCQGTVRHYLVALEPFEAWLSKVKR